MTTLTAVAVFSQRTWRPPMRHMCLLHADYHVLAVDCVAALDDFFDRRPHLRDDPEARDAYQAAVERRMLDTLVHAQITIPSPR